MNRKEIKKVLSKNRKTLIAKDGVVGTAIGRKIVNGKPTDELAIVCFVKKKKKLSSLNKQDLIPAKIENVQTDVIESGEFKALAIDPKTKIRPAPGGVSVGHFNITAGTLGMWVKKDGVYYILSNNHVLADENNAMIGDAILQPGAYDSGVNPSDKIAELTNFVPINFVGDNLVDAALAKVVGNGSVPPPVEPPPDKPSDCTIANLVAKLANFAASMLGRKTRFVPIIPYQVVDDYVLDEIANIGKPVGIIEAAEGMGVKKMGRTTELTNGAVVYIDAEVQVGYTNQDAYFVDQIIITPGGFSAGGDSGSIIVTDDGQKVVGLLFAGSDQFTIANRIQNVFNAFPGMTL